MNKVHLIHILALYGNVDDFKSYYSPNLYKRYKHSLDYCIYKGAFINKYFYDFFNDINDEYICMEQLHSKYNYDNKYVGFNYCPINFNINFEIGKSIDSICYPEYTDEFIINFDKAPSNFPNVVDYGFIYLDKFVLNMYLDSKLKFDSEFNNFTPYDILNNTELAIYCHRNNIFSSLALSRLLVVDFERVSKLINKDTFLKFYINTPHIYLLPYECEYVYYKLVKSDITINQLMLIYYYKILYEKVNIDIIYEEEDIDFIEYNILNLLHLYNKENDIEKVKNMKIIKLFDIEEEIYVNETILNFKSFSSIKYLFYKSISA